MPYANITNISSFTNLLQYVNGQEPIFGPMIVFTCFVVFFLAIKGRFSTSRAFAGSSFITMIVAVLMRVLELVSDYIIALAVVCLLLGVYWLRNDQQ
jgi:hypothetical protein